MIALAVATRGLWLEQRRRWQGLEHMHASVRTAEAAGAAASQVCPYNGRCPRKVAPWACVLITSKGCRTALVSVPDNEPAKKVLIPESTMRISQASRWHGQNGALFASGYGTSKESDGRCTHLRAGAQPSGQMTMHLTLVRAIGAEVGLSGRGHPGVCTRQGSDHRRNHCSRPDSLPDYRGRREPEPGHCAARLRTSPLARTTFGNPG